MWGIDPCAGARKQARRLSVIPELVGLPINTVRSVSRPCPSELVSAPFY